VDPRREEPKAPKPRPEQKRKRFRLIKLEERVTPHGGGPISGGRCTIASIE
jgi:hypothetical protein